MPTYHASVHIDAALDDVFGRVADIERHGEWSADALTIVREAEGRYRSTAEAKGKTFHAELLIVERSSPDRFVFDAVDATGRWRHTFDLTASGGGTTVTRSIAGKLDLKQSMLYWLVLLPIKKPALERSLERLKADIEGSSGA